MTDGKKNLIKAITHAVHVLHQLPEKRSELIVAALAQSGLVNEKYYNGAYPDVAISKYPPVTHYALYGYNEGRIPAPELAELIPALPRETTSGSNSLEQFLERLLANLLTGKAGTTERPVVIRQGAYESLYDLPLYVHWSITKMCNYKCSYCSYRHGEDKSVNRAGLVPFQKLVNAVNNLAAMNRPLYEMVLLGGEPTVHPRLPELLLHAESRLQGRLRKVTIVTNGSREPEWFNQLADQARRLPLLITVSIHAEQVNPEHIYNLIHKLDPALQLHFIVMMHPEKKELVAQIHGKLCELRAQRVFDVWMQPIFAPPAFTSIDPRYPPDFLDWRNALQTEFAYAVSNANLGNIEKTSTFHTFWEVNENGRSSIVPEGDRSILHQHGLLNFQGMNCVCGTNLARIDEDGSLLGGVCVHATTPFNLYEPNAIKDSSFMRIVNCPSPFCTCNDNDINMKFRDRDEAEEYLRMARLKQDRLLLPVGNPSLPL